MLIQSLFQLGHPKLSKTDFFARQSKYSLSLYVWQALLKLFWRPYPRPKGRELAVAFLSNEQ
jgi:hypothetical protein